MMRRLPHLVFVSLLLIGLPMLSYAASGPTVAGGRNITVSTSTTNNAYFAAGQVTVDAPLPDDLCAAGGTITVAAPVGRDALLAGGTIDLQKPVAGNARLAGGRVMVDDTVGGDLVAGGGFVTVSGRPNDAYILGGTVDMTDGANGPVTIYGADVYLSGEFDGDVNVVASDRVSLADNTVIHGAFKYNAPQQADIPASAVIDRGVTYTGTEPYLPTAQQAKTFALAGLWVFILVRITAGLVAAGLVTGLFPALTDRVVDSVLTRSIQRLVLLTLLGFAGFVAAPVLFILLIASFVGIGVALILGAAYLLFLLLAYVYAAVLAGAAFMRLFRKNYKVSWHTALLGVLIMFVIGYIPFVGFWLKVILCATAGGALLAVAYTFAFRNSLRDLADF